MTRKLAKYFKHDLYGSMNSKTYKVRTKAEALLESFWFRTFVPFKWQLVFMDVVFELKMVSIRNDMLLEEYASACVDLHTYRHNAEAQKSKTKKYSLMREQEYRRSLEKNCPNFHEHENGL
jgi:hypothetical protein